MHQPPHLPDNGARNNTGVQMGLLTATALVVGNIIGGGVFLLPATLAPFGYNALFSWAITLCGGICLAYVFATLAREMPDAGGVFGFMRRSLGEVPAFIGSWGYWLSVWTAIAGIATSGIAYLGELVPIIKTVTWAPPLIAIGLLWLFTAINLLGVHTAGPMQVVTTLVKLLPLIAIPVLLLLQSGKQGAGQLPSFNTGHISWSGISSGLLLTLFAILGLESAAVPGDKIKNPGRNVPLSTMLGTVVSGLLMMLSFVAVFWLVPSSAAAASPAPISLLFSQSWGHWAGLAVAVCAVVSAYGAINGWVLLSGELPATMASRKGLPAWFGRRNRRGAPYHAILLSAALTTILIVFSFSGSMTSVFSFAISLSSVTCLVLYIFCCIGALRLMAQKKLKISVALLFAAVVGLLFSLLALQGVSGDVIVWALVLLLAGWPLYSMALREQDGGEKQER
jgi:basic amino acid/polyamine antiporter, APA family